MFSDSMRISYLNYITHALVNESARLGTVNPQYSYFKRLWEAAIGNDAEIVRLHNHIQSTGGFSGL